MQPDDGVELDVNLDVELVLQLELGRRRLGRGGATFYARIGRHRLVSDR